MKARYDVYERLRNEKGLSDADVAKATGITRSTFSDWKSGRSIPGNEKIYKLVRFFDVNYYVFFNSDDSHTPFSSGEGGTTFILYPEESALICNYRTLNDAGRHEVRNHMEYVLSQDRYHAVKEKTS